MLIRNLLKFTLISLLTSFVTSSCSTTKKMAYNQKKIGHESLYSYPAKIEYLREEDDRYKRLVIVGLNDFNANIYPHSTELTKDKDFNIKREIKVGGIDGLKAYFDIFNATFKNQILFLDSGSFTNPKEDHKRTFFLYNYLNFDAVNIGINELTLETKNEKYSEYLTSLTKNANFDILSSNIFDLKEVEQISWPPIKSKILKTKNNIKVGILGMLSQEMAKNNFDNKLNGLYVQDMTKNIIIESNKLRRDGAKVIILMANHGIDCTEIVANNTGIDKHKVNFNPYDISGCDANENELVKTLSLLPPGKIDLVLSSGKKSKVVNFIHDIPVLQSFGDGEYISWAEMYYDSKLQQVFPEDLRLHQPIQVCHQFFEKTRDCFYENEDTKELLMPATLFGVKVELSPIP